MRSVRHGGLCLMSLAVLTTAGTAWPGELAGHLTNAAGMRSVQALDRDTEKTYPGKLDPAAGTYLFENLPAGAYDLILQSRIGRIEGVNLRLPAGQTEPLSLTPGPVDRGDLDDLVTGLRQVAEQQEKLPETAAVRCRLERMRVTAVRLQPRDDKQRTIEVGLIDEELAHVTDVLVGTVSLFKVRDRLPDQGEIVLGLGPDGRVAEIRVVSSPRELAQEDRAWLLDWIDRVKTFENRKRVLFLRGNDTEARALVEKIRDQPTSLPTEEPTAFWRVEIWTFRKLHGGWEKTDYLVQARRQMTLREFGKLNWVFEPALGGFAVPANGRTTVPDYAVPDRLDPAAGRVAP